MTLDVTQLEPRLLPTVCDGYRQIAEANRMLFAQTGKLSYRERAEYAERKVLECEAAGVVDWEA